MSQMFHYFCGMHLLVNMAENVTEALRLFENANATSDNESCTVRLPAKLFQDGHVKNQVDHYNFHPV